MKSRIHAVGRNICLGCQRRKNLGFRSPKRGGLLLVSLKDASRTIGFTHVEPWASLE